MQNNAGQGNGITFTHCEGIQFAVDHTGERFIPGADSGLMEAEHVQRYVFAGGYVKGMSVLDIACGAGYGSSLLFEAGAADVTGVDISEEAIQFALSHYGKDRIKFIARNAEKFKNGMYDVIVSFETLEHLEKRQQFLENLRSMMKAQGVLIISTPNKTITSPMKNPSEIRNVYHKYEYLEKDFVAALQNAGFKTIQKFGQHAYPGIFKFQPLSRLLRRHWNWDRIETAVVSPMAGNFVPRYFVFVAGI
jgi:2-polyprenyl-3-methyl-5-hydroxy-6-metoxy-1,4-benzoquinol methylase